MAQGSDVQDRRYWANIGLPSFPPSTSDIISTHLERSSPSFPWILFFCHKRKIIEIETTSPNSLTILNLKRCQVAAWELLKGLQLPFSPEGEAPQQDFSTPWEISGGHTAQPSYSLHSIRDSRVLLCSLPIRNAEVSKVHYVFLSLKKEIELWQKGDTFCQKTNDSKWLQIV